MSITLKSAVIGVLLTGAAAAVSAPAFAQSPSVCPTASAEQPARKKGFGFGKLLSGARSSGLIGSVMGATRGDGNLKADLTDTARRAATGAAERAVGCLEQQASSAAASGGDPRAAEQPRDTPAAVPVRRKEAAAVSYTSEIADPAGFQAIKRAYDDFGKVDCTSCEGGYAYDGWAVFPRDEFSGKYGGDDQRIGFWPVGHVHRWQGNESNGSLTVVAEETVSGFRCRTLRYRLEKGSASAERPGLICWGRGNQFAGKESWNEVY